MNTEEKAKAYDEAVNKLRRFMEQGIDPLITRANVQDFFPELTESNDERIRKELIDAILGLWDNDALPMPLSVKRKDEWIAWLEKQKEYESTDFEYVWDRTDCGDLTSALDKYSEEAIINMCHAWYDKGIELERKSWLEKQCYTKKDVDDAYLKGICYTKHELEKQGERSIYNVPSREVILAIWDLGNEWKELTNGCISAEHGTQLNYIQKHWEESEYYLREKQGKQKPSLHERYDKIKDSEWFKKTHEGMSISDDENVDGDMKETEHTIKPKFNEGDWITNGDYTWKVIKVEQFDYILQSQDGNIVDDTISYVDKQFHSFTVKDAKDGDVLCTYECGTPKIVFILKGTPKKHYALGYHCYYNIMYPHFGPDSEKGCLAPNDEDVKPATKEQRDTLERAITNAGYTFNFEKKELKKIKQKPQRMVSAEAKEALYDKPTDEEMKELLRTEYEKGRADTIAEMEKNWSEEDEDTLAAIIAIIRKQYNGTNIEEKKYYNVLINWLKSLKDRYTWRPSNEQIDTLEHFVRSIGESGYASPYDNNTKLLYSLLKQLKKLKA